jgi:GGDEF domain-containing protein
MCRIPSIITADEDAATVMAMVSIRRYLNLATVEERPGTALALVLQRLRDIAVDWDPEETESFRDEMYVITGGLAPDLPQKEQLVIVEAAMQAVESHNRKIVQMVEKQYDDFQAIIKMLADSIVRIAGPNAESVQSLQKIDSEFERGAGFRNLNALRQHLTTCLPGIRKEIEHETIASRALIEKLQIEIESNARPGEREARKRVDSATGLPGQPECLAAIREVIATGTRHYAVVMVVNRVDPIAARFGKDAGDWMLGRFREYIERQFEETDLLFRWSGPALVAIIERPQTFDQVRAVIKRIFEAPINETIDVNGRSVFVPITAAWSVSMICATPETTEKQIQKFVAGQGCRDFV